MTGIIPNEGETLRGQMVWKRLLGDRDADLELGLFTNASISETTTLAQITEPTGGGYARIDLVDANWTEDDNAGDRRFNYPLQTFSPVGTDYSAPVHGYFIASKASAGTPRLLVIEQDLVNAPLQLNVGDTYDITLAITEQ